MIIKGGNIFMLQGNRNAEQITKKKKRNHKKKNNIRTTII